MTTMLVLGGTAWVGREVVRAAQDAGMQVTCLARGESGEPLPQVEWVRADRSAPDAYTAVRERDWDVVLDVSWQPSFVRSALAELADRTKHWVYVSSCSVYADQSVPEANESAPLLAPFDGALAPREAYGQAKVACEQACTEAVADRLLMARSCLIGGYGDPSDRFGYWPARFAAAASGAVGWAGSPAVLVPDEPDLPTQTLDVRDLAEWLVQCGQQRTTGIYDVAGPRHQLGEVLDVCRSLAGYEGPMQAIPSDWLLAQGVEEYMGLRSLPLWLVDPDWRGFSARDGQYAKAAGWDPRPLADLVGESLRWEAEQGLGRERHAGLSPTQEHELLARWAGTQRG